MAKHKKTKSVTRHKSTTPLILQSNISSGAFGEPTAQNYQSYLEAYTNEAWVYICVYKIANTIAGLPIKLYKPVKTNPIEYKEIEQHDFLNLLAKPNDKDTQIDLMESLVANSELSGNGYFLKDEQVAFKPKKLYSLISSRVRVLAKNKGYTYRAKEIAVTFKPEDISHFLYFNPLSEYYGLSPISAGRYIIEADQQSNKFNTKFFKQGAAIDGVLETDESLSPEVFDRLKIAWAQRYTGVENAHKIAILEQGLQYKPIQLSHRDMEFINGTKINRETICAIFGVPPAVVGLFEYANYANSKEQKKIFWNETIIPKLRKFRAYLQKILDLWDPSLFVDFDLSNVESLRDDEVQKSETAVRYFGIGIPLNRIIEKLNLPFDAVDGGDVGYLPMMLAPIGAKPTEPTPVPVIPEPEKHYKSIPKDKKKLKWEAMIKVTEALELKYIDVLNKYFTRQRNIVLANLNKYKNVRIEAVAPGINYIYELVKEEKDGKKTNTKRQIDIDDVLFDYDKETDKFFVVSKPVKREAVSQAGKAEFALLNLQIAFDMDSTNVVNYLTENALKKAKLITGTAGDAVKTALIEGVKERESVAQLSKRIRETYLQYTEVDLPGYAAKRIARTELIDASNFGSVESYKQANVEKKEWVSTFDDRTTDICIALDGQVVDVDKKFHSTVTGEDYDYPPAHINCRATVAPMIKE